MRRALDLLLRGLIRLTLGIFHREIELVGEHRLPSRGPVIYVGNHYNSLIDPALVLGWMPLGIRMLAKSTLWSQFPAGLFVRLAAAVPVYRQVDHPSDTSKNVEMFSRCWEILGRGGSIALFPEGLSHDEPMLQPLKTGAARIALGTLTRHPEVALTIVPIGLIFEERERFRSRALIEVGHPLDPREFPAAGGERDQQAVRALTRHIQDVLASATLNYSTWQEAEFVRRAADLYVSDLPDIPAGSALSNSLPYQRAFAEGYAEIKQRYPEETARVRRQTEAYARLLDLTGLSDRQVSSEYQPQLVARFLTRSAFDLLLLLPVGFVGTLIHWLPYKVPQWAVRMLPIERDLHATFKVMISLLVFPLAWLGGAYLAYRQWGYSVALPFLLVVPLTGWAALLLKERLERLFGESRAYLMLKGSDSLSPRLRKRREALLDSIHRLVERYVADK